MILETIALAEINPAPYNPRKNLQPGDPEYESLKRSVTRWGLVEPLVWNKQSGNLVGGHQRLKILLEQGETEAQVSVVELDENDEAALNVALNKIDGEWDKTRLADLLSELDANGYDATLTGFSLDELEALLAPDVGMFEEEEAEQEEVPDAFVVVVTLENEAEQNEFLEELLERGMNCRATMS